MTKRRSPGPPRLFWSAEDVQLLRDRYPDTPTQEIANQIGRNLRAVYAKAKQLGLAKSREYLSSAASGRLQKVSGHGVATRFKPGSEPWNKGTNYVAGGRSAETRFRAGGIPHTTVPVGTEQVRQGYLWRKVRDDLQPTRHNWREVHVIVWEQHNGPRPDGHAIVFRNGDRSDIRIQNLDLVSRADLARRNAYHRFPPEVRQVIRAKGALTRQINKLTREPA